MLSLDDCLALCHLSDEEIAAIAEHEHIPYMTALELGDALCHTRDGTLRIKRMILEDIAAARKREDFVHSAKLKTTLKHFIESHPDAREFIIV